MSGRHTRSGLCARLWDELSRPRSLSRSRRRARRSGVALLVVITTMMVLTILVTDLTYTARIRMLLAAHERDRVEAYWLARSGVNIYRLILVANKQLEKNSTLEQLTENLPINLGDALWQMVPVINTGLLRAVLASDSGSGDLSMSDLDPDQLDELRKTGQLSEEVAQASRESAGGLFSDENFLDFDGDFSAEIHDNESKINVNLLASESDPVQTSATGMLLYAMMSGTDNAQWFTDHNLDRWELIGNLKDWVDADNTRSAGTGGHEDSLYNHLDDPYLTKNAPFDTIEEIRLVDGWQDEVYDRFKDQLTIWGNGKLNISSMSDDQLKTVIRAHATSPPSDFVLDQCITNLRQYMLITRFKKGQDFADWVESNCFPVDDNLASILTTSSHVFTIVSTGLVGTSSVRITAVYDYSNKTTGVLKYWKVE